MTRDHSSCVTFDEMHMNDSFPCICEWYALWCEAASAAFQSATILRTIHQYRPFFMHVVTACSSRQGDEGPWVWPAYRAERCLISPRISGPCFLTVLRGVHSQAFEGGIGAPRSLASKWFLGSLIGHVMLARDAGA